MTKEQFYKIWGISAIIGVIGVSIWFYTEVPSPKIDPKEIIDLYREESYSGKVLDRYIDTDQHNYHKIILEENNNERIILMDWEIGGLFNFVQKGDTLHKESGSLDVNLKRKDLDTIITMKFYSKK